MSYTTKVHIYLLLWMDFLFVLFCFVFFGGHELRPSQASRDQDCGAVISNTLITMLRQLYSRVYENHIRYFDQTHNLF